MEKAEKKGVTIHLPTDFVTADKFDKDAEVSKFVINLLLHVTHGSRRIKLRVCSADDG